MEVHHFISKETTKLAEDFLVPRVIFQAHFRLDLKKKTICKYNFFVNTNSIIFASSISRAENYRYIKVSSTMYM